MLEPRPTFTACPACGAAMHRDEDTEAHVCDDVRQFVRAEIAAFDSEFEAWLATPHGQFAAWLARQDLAA